MALFQSIVVPVVKENAHFAEYLKSVVSPVSLTHSFILLPKRAALIISAVGPLVRRNPKRGPQTPTTMC